ncbi:MAG: M67 family metallopeptidase [Actinomycetota bacterium]|jgi:proteasome lid subunit RPN8/RPN11|nr:M67 family metallopeptidase [Actinomycetota bacterium]
MLEEIFAHANRESPNEACGWLAGRNGAMEESEGARLHAARREILVQKTYPVPNASEHPGTRFVMEPESQISAMREIRNSGLEIVGTYHSHPKSPAHPSESDLELALYPDIVHLIVSLTDGEARWWRISNSGIEEA